MKKNISINISGIIFHIEEDGYDTLRKYLDSINQYFGTFEDSSEILADIESRIAEIFLSKLNDGKQIITLEDVQSLTATMGSVNDFKAAEDQETPAAETRTEDKTETPPYTGTYQKAAYKKLLRDQKRKIIGGVCAGLGNYFSIDPVWPRLLFGLLILGTYGIFSVVYVVLWITLPFSHDLEDEPAVKKMYRDPDGKVIGGVAGGIAAFFGADVMVIRVLFGAFTFFFGAGLVIYIILWIALPEAKTITDKMQMQGEPVTLSNIETSVKKSLHEKDGAEESTLAKIVLFPFRIIAAVLTGIVKILGPVFRLLIDIVRTAIGVVISLTGVMMIITLIMMAGILLGFFPFSSFNISEWHLTAANFPLGPIRMAFPTWTIIFSFVAVFIPALFITMLGNSIIAKKIVWNSLVGWTLFVTFFVSVAFLSFRIPQIIYSFKEEGEVKVEKIFKVDKKTPVLKIKETGMDDYDFTDLAISGYSGKDIKLVERFGAQGISRLVAKENAMMITYNVDQADTVINFDSNVTFKPDAKFAFQKLDMDLYIPYDQPFTVDPEMWRLIRSHWRYDYPGNEEIQTYKLTSKGRLECISCAKDEDRSGIASNDEFGLKDFKEIEMSGIFNVVIRQGDEYSINIAGSESQKKLYKVDVNEETLEVSYANHNKSFWKDNFVENDFVELTIVMPSLKKLNVTGAGKLKVYGFNEDEIKIALTGAMVVDAKISAQQIYIDLAGLTVLELDGEGDFMEAVLSKGANLKAASYTVNRASIEAIELAQARVHVNNSLEMDKDLTSTIRYQGNPEIVKHE